MGWGWGCHLLTRRPGYGRGGTLESVQVKDKTELQTLTEHRPALTVMHSCHRELFCPRSICTAPQGKGHCMRCSKCPGGTNVTEFSCSVFYWEGRHLNPGRDAFPWGRQGRGGEEKTPPKACLPCSVYSASRPDKEAKGRGPGSALSLVLDSNSWRHRTLSRSNCWKHHRTQDTATSGSPGNHLQGPEALLGRL